MVGVDSRSWRPGRSDGRAGLARVVMFFAVTDRNKKKHQLLASRAGALLRRDPPRARDALALSKHRGLAPALLRDLAVRLQVPTVHLMRYRTVAHTPFVLSQICSE